MLIPWKILSIRIIHAAQHYVSMVTEDILASANPAFRPVLSLVHCCLIWLLVASLLLQSFAIMAQATVGYLWTSLGNGVALIVGKPVCPSCGPCRFVCPVEMAYKEVIYDSIKRWAASIYLPVSGAVEFCARPSHCQGDQYMLLVGHQNPVSKIVRETLIGDKYVCALCPQASDYCFTGIESLKSSISSVILYLSEIQLRTNTVLYMFDCIPYTARELRTLKPCITSGSGFWKFL